VVQLYPSVNAWEYEHLTYPCSASIVMSLLLHSGLPSRSAFSSGILLQQDHHFYRKRYGCPCCVSLTLSIVCLVYSTRIHSVLPTPVHISSVSDDEDNLQEGPSEPQSNALISRVPPYGQRRGWKPSGPEDFGELYAIRRFFSFNGTSQAMVVHSLSAM
jgi:hypothetical protein